MKPNMIILDDCPITLAAVSAKFANDFNIVLVTTIPDLINSIKLFTPDILLLDIMIKDDLTTNHYHTIRDLSKDSRIIFMSNSFHHKPKVDEYIIKLNDKQSTFQHKNDFYGINKAIDSLTTFAGNAIAEHLTC